MTYTAANAAITSQSGADRCESVVASVFMLVARLCRQFSGKRKPTAGGRRWGCETWLIPGVQPPPSAGCARATLRSQAARFGIQCGLMIVGFITSRTCEHSSAVVIAVNRLFVPTGDRKVHR